MVDFEDFLEQIDKQKEGYFLVENRLGKAYLAVFSPQNKKNIKQRVSLDEVIQRLDVFQIHYDLEKVRKIVEEASGIWYEIGLWEEPESEDAKIHIRIENNFKEALLEITPPVYKGKWISYEKLKQEIESANIRIGVDDELLKKIANRELDELKNIKEPLNFLIAKAIEPIPPESGKIKFYFNPEPKIHLKEDEYGKVDFRSLNIIQTCGANELLAEIIPSKEGKEGLDILGNPIPCGEPAKAVIEAGENTELRDNQLYSIIAGQIKFITNPNLTYAKIYVEPILRLEKVDFSTGNIEFPGTVIISERVLDGFEVKSRGDIIIEKSIGNVKLYSEGDIILNGGIISKGNAIVYSEKDIYARFIQNANITAKNNLYVEELILHSEILVGKELHIFQGRGEIIGGKIVCGEKIIAKKIGSVAEPYTQIFMGILPDIFLRINDINSEIEKNSKLLKEIEKNMNYLENHQEKLEDEKTRKFYEKLKIANEKLKNLQNNLYYQKEILILNEKSNLEAMVIIRECLFPNVEIIFGARNRKYKQQKTTLNRQGYLKYSQKDHIVKFYSKT